MIRAEIVTDGAALERLREPWRDLLARSSNDEPMASPTWLLTWWSVFGEREGNALRTVALFDGKRLVGLAPLSLRERRIAPGWTVRSLELLGTGEDERDEIGSDYLGILVERGAEQAVLGAFVDALHAGALGTWDELVLSPMNGECPVGVFLADILRKRGCATSLDAVGASFHVPLPPTWEAYLAALPSSRRAMIRRSIRSFDHWAGGDVRFEIARTPEDVARLREDLVRLHGTRWASAGKDGAFASPRFARFHDDVIPRLFDEGALELASLRARGRIVAALYNVVWRGKVHFYQCGRAMDVPSDLRPGVVIHSRAIAHAIERGLREYDFLPSLARYKIELSLASRPILTLRAARPTAALVARRMMRVAAEHARAVGRGRARRAPERTPSNREHE